MPSMSNVTEDIRMVFECPKCGNTTFGTANATKAFEEWVGHCHNDSLHCDFRWSRTNDWQHFKLVKTHVINFENRERYEQAVKALNESEDY